MENYKGLDHSWFDDGFQSLNDPATTFDGWQFSLKTSSSFDNKRFEGNGFVCCGPNSAISTLIIQTIKHWIGQIILRRNAEVADGAVTGAAGARAPNAGAKGWRCPNMASDLNLKTHGGMIVGVHIAKARVH